MEGASTAADLVTSVTDMAGKMLTTMVSNPILAVPIGVAIAGAIVVLVRKLRK